MIYARRFLELLLIFIGVPILVYMHMMPIPGVFVLFIFAALAAIILWFTPDFHFRDVFRLPKQKNRWSILFIKSVVVALFLLGITWYANRPGLFQLPLQHPLLWVLILCFYPILSAFPQELLYRTFFFQRYQSLLPGRWAMVAGSALVFSFLHIVFHNDWAMSLALAGGFLFSQTYTDTRSLPWVTLEHTIYGYLIFTIGMGHYFYEPFF